VSPGAMRRAGMETKWASKVTQRRVSPPVLRSSSSIDPLPPPAAAQPQDPITRAAPAAAAQVLLNMGGGDHAHGGFDAGRHIGVVAKRAQRATEGGDRDHRIDRFGGRAHMADADQLAVGFAAAG